MTLKLSGKLHSATPTEQKSEKFQVRTFVLEISETTSTGQVYTNYAQFQLVNNNCSILDNFRPGQQVTVSFDVRGQFWQDKCITNLNAWKIEAVQQQQAAQQPAAQAPPPTQQQWGQQQPPSAPQWTPPSAPPAQQWGAPPAANHNEDLPF